MTRRDAYTRAQQAGPEAAFVANVVLCHHPRAARRLRGLVALLDQGHDVRCAPHALDVLLVDGAVMPWSRLEQFEAVNDFLAGEVDFSCRNVRHFIE